MQTAIYTAKFKTIIYIMWTNFFITQCFVLKERLPISHKNSHVTRKVVKYFRHFFPSIPTEIGIWLVSTFVVKTEKRQASLYSVFMPSIQSYQLPPHIIIRWVSMVLKPHLTGRHYAESKFRWNLPHIRINHNSFSFKKQKLHSAWLWKWREGNWLI